MDKDTIKPNKRKPLLSKRDAVVLIVVVAVIAVAVISVCAFQLYNFIAFLRGDYNRIMYKHLSSADNYEWTNVTYKCAYYYDSDHKQVFIDAGNIPYDMPDGIYLKCDEATTYGDPQTVIFSVNKSNADILRLNGFFDSVSENAEIKVRASRWIYMDSRFYFVASMQYDGVTYLDFDEGLKNIIAEMDAHRMFLI